MKHTKEEITNALNVIKEECKDDFCVRCPFYDKTLNDVPKCRIRSDAPMSWDLNTPVPETWRAFK